MPDAKGRRWTRDEAAKALSLYCQLTFGQMDARNVEVRALAKALDRTPGSIALKLVNFASLDPIHRARGVGGMSNTSALDREVWEYYFNNWDALADIAVPIAQSAPPEVITFDDEGHAIAETELRRYQKARRGQQFFRNTVLAAYQFKCCITGITNPRLLRAGHIMPWALTPMERLNPRNGLCLNSLHDAAFDAGLITFSPNLTLQTSKRLKKEMPAQTFDHLFSKFENAPIKRPEKFPPLESALTYHRTHIFKQ